MGKHWRFTRCSIDLEMQARVHLVLPVYNRRETTLLCLTHLRDSGVGLWAQIVVVDDGSKDGTAEAIRAAFPEIIVLPGDGNLYWTGATALGMRRAMADGTACCVWLNDDSHPLAGAVERVVDHALETGGICSGLGRFVGSSRGHTFTALHQGRWGLRQQEVDFDKNKARIAVDCCRGNLVAIPRAVIEKIGYPDAENLPQYFADTDYTLRATSAGFSCVIDPQAVTEEMEHSGDFDEPWLTTSKPLSKIWARFALKQSGLYWWANWIYLRRHWGPWRGGLLFAAPYVRLVGVTLARAAIPPRWWNRLLGKSR